MQVWVWIWNVPSICEAFEFFVSLAYMMHFQCSIIQIIDIMIWHCRWLYFELDCFTEALHLAPHECHYSVRVPGSQ